MRTEFEIILQNLCDDGIEILESLHNEVIENNINALYKKLAEIDEVYAIITETRAKSISTFIKKEKIKEIGK